MYVTNQLQTAPNVYQFDVYLLNTSLVELKLANVQSGLFVDPFIKNRCNITVAYMAGSSGLSASQVPVIVQFVNTVNYFNLAAWPNSGTANARVINTENKGRKARGTQIGAFVVTNSVNFTGNATANSVCSLSQASGRTNRMVSAYDAKGTPVVLISNENHVGWGAPNSCYTNAY